MTDASAYIESLRSAIRRLHGCDSKHCASVPVVERFRGEVVWDGTVEVFELIGHATAKRCYAWSHAEGAQDEHTRFVAVLELPPVDSAQKAVQAEIVASSKRKR